MVGRRWPGTWADVLGVLAWGQVLTWGLMLSTPDGKLVGVYGWYMMTGRGWHGDGM